MSSKHSYPVGDDCLNFLRSKFSEQDIATARGMLDAMTTHDGAGPPTDFMQKDLMSVYAYYNGTCFPVIEGFDSPDHWEERKGEYQNVLVSGVRAGYSLKQQGIDYTKQMVSMEGCLQKHAKKDPSGTMGKKVLQDACEELNLDPHEFQQYWYMNVYNLLKLKVIEDNDHFGFLIMGSPQNGCQYPEQAERMTKNLGEDIAKTYTMSDHDPTIKAFDGSSCLPKNHEATCETGFDFCKRHGVDVPETKKAKKNRQKKEQKKAKAAAKKEDALAKHILQVIDDDIADETK